MPSYLDTVDVYEVRPPVEGASTTAAADPQFGGGGSHLAYVTDLQGAIDRGELAWVREHHFSPSTLESRFEDPRFTQVDDGLVGPALDPAFVRREASAEASAMEAGKSAVTTAATTGAAAASNYIDQEVR
jgi:hypothetical protein